MIFRWPWMRVRSLEELYLNSKVFGQFPQLLPIENGPDVLRFELTQREECQHCSGCDGCMGNYRIRSIETFRSHVDAVVKRIGTDTPLARSVWRAYIGSGISLSVGTGHLEEAIRITVEGFRALTSEHRAPRSVSVLADTNDIIGHGLDGLHRLRKAGLTRVHWEIASGSIQTLAFAHKDDSPASMREASDLLKAAGIEASVIVYPGLGGKRYAGLHTRDTIAVVTGIRPSMLTFLSISPKNRYHHDLICGRGNGEHRLLTEPEIVTQTHDMLSGITFESQCVVACPACSDGMFCNPLPFGPVVVPCEIVRDTMVDHLRTVAAIAFA